MMGHTSRLRSTQGSEVTSVIVKNEEGEVEEVRLAFEFQPSDRLPYIPLVDETNSGIFIGNTESKIPLPPSLPFCNKYQSVYCWNQTQILATK